MRRALHFMLLCVLFVPLCLSCDPPVPVPDSATLNVSPSGTITLDAAGNPARIVITTNQDEIRVESLCWCYVVFDQYDLLIYADENTSTSPLGPGIVTIEVGEGDNIATCNLTMYQEGAKIPEKPENKSVGASGGEIVSSGLEMTVPAACFADSITFEITKQNDQAVMGQYEGSDYYQVSLPADFAQPISVSLAADGTLSGDVFLTVISDGWVACDDTLGTTSRMVKAELKDGRYVAAIEPFNDASNKGETATITLGLVKDYESFDLATKAIANEKKCAVFAPVAYHHLALDLSSYARDAFDKLEAIGFTFEQRSSQIQLHVKDLGKDSYGFLVHSKWSNDYSHVEINSQKLSETDNMKKTIIHELCHLSQAYFDNRTCLIKGMTANPFLWMDEAVATWVERMYSTSISNLQEQNKMCPLEGFDPSENENVAKFHAQHGYGMSGLIRWLDKKYGSDAIKKLYTARKEGASNIYNAFEKAFPDLFTQYTFFLEDYIRGEVFSEHKNILQSCSNTFHIENSNSYTKEYTMPRYSMSVWKLRVSDKFDIGSKSLMIKMESGPGTLFQLYRYNSSTNSVEFVKDLGASYRYQDIKAIQSKGEYLYVVCYNKYLSDNKAKVTVQLSDQMDYSKCTLYCEIDGVHFKGFHTSFDPPEVDDYGFFVLPIMDNNTITGKTETQGSYLKFTSNKEYAEDFEGIFSYHLSRSWNVTFLIDPQTSTIVSGQIGFTSKKIDDFPSPYLAEKDTLHLELKDFPFASKGGTSSYREEIYGFPEMQTTYAVEDYITALYYEAWSWSAEQMESHVVNDKFKAGAEWCFAITFKEK